MVFTEDEQVVIRSLNPDIKYLARDMDGSLYGHSEKPLKQAAAWESIGNLYDLTSFTNAFQGITWKDKEPTYIGTGAAFTTFGKWTNVDDGLPGHDGLYIVSVVPAVNGEPTGEFFPESRIVSEYSVIKGWGIEQCESLENPPKVTHWMPWPSAPERSDNVIAVIDPETKSKYWISLNDYINAQPTVPQFGQWINVKDDTPQIAGCEVLLVVENKFEQRRIITAFQGYGDFKWHTSNVDYMAYRPDDFLSDKWKPLYWMPLPEPPKAKYALLRLLWGRDGYSDTQSFE